MFSSRLPASLSPNRLTEAVSRRRRPFIDLTLSNPTVAGFAYPDRYLDSLARPEAALYAPDPRGLLSAREAVAESYSRKGIECPASRIVLSASSSEAYSWLFKLLGNPGDAILVPAPSYPLLDALAGLEGLTVNRYPLDRSHRWAVSAHLIAEEIGALAQRGRRVAAVVLVNPNNPTGTSIDADEFEELLDVVVDRDIALISDEVFLDYRFESQPRGVRVAAAQASLGPAARGLVFSLGGLSKAAGMPQVKAGWILAGGSPALVEEALPRLEWVADSFLSIGTPVQTGLRELLLSGDTVARQIRDRVIANHGILERSLSRLAGVGVTPLTGGWSACLRVPAVIPEEELVLSLLEKADVLVHPGFFFDFPFEAFLVVSLLCPDGEFREGVERLERFLEAL